MGASSYTTIFKRLPHGSNDEAAEPFAAQRQQSPGQARPLADSRLISEGAVLIEQLAGTLNVSACVKLVEAWTAKGANLPLAGRFTKRCAETTERLLTAINEGMSEATTASTNLFIHSRLVLRTHAEGTVEDYCENFCHPNSRWETIGLFCTAVSRAAIDVLSFDSLYETQHQRRRLQTIAMQYSDRCLDIALSLDCLNDLQLILQYENFISHSIVDGDQSRLGFYLIQLF